MLKSISFYAVLTLQISFCSAQVEPGISSSQPNIILILVDDLGYEDLSFNGAKDISTPNIDRIANEGVKFTEGYVTYAVCGPSRAGLITGRYQDRFGFGRNPLFAPNDPNMGLPLTEETLAEALKRANYKSIALGKWHLGAHESLRPLRRGFDDFFGFLSGGHSYFPELWTLKNEFEVDSQFGAYHTKLLKDNTRVEESEYLTDALSREAVNYIEKYKSQSFFMYLAYNAPHAPLQATEKYLNRFKHIEDLNRRTYAAMVSAVDDGVGAIQKKIESLGISDNTIIIFLSDNGGPENKNASNNGVLRGGKGDLLEGGIRVPFAMKWPRHIPKGLVYDSPVISLDIFATVIAQAESEIELRNNLDGVNLMPYLTGENTNKPHDYLFWRKYDQEEYAVRTNSGKKIVGKKDRTKLFDLTYNISENPNLIFEDQKTVKNLYKKYQVWLQQMTAPKFLGLSQNNEYNEEFPNRFVKQH